MGGCTTTLIPPGTDRIAHSRPFFITFEQFTSVTGTTSAFSFAATLNAPFLKSAIVPSTERVPSGKNSTEQSF